MSFVSSRQQSKHIAINREERFFERPTDSNGNYQRVTDYYGENIFHFSDAQEIPASIRAELEQAVRDGAIISREHAEVVAKAVTEWAIKKGATHFCHWFQPLTGSTAEKHDAFLEFEGNENPIETLSANQLIQGEPDASSFPNGGSRSTFEARGYTAWDLTSPMFLKEGANGMTLCIPTAFVSYHGEALDIKTPLLRSVSTLNKEATRFMNLIGHKDVKRVNVTCGAEQEYFLIDKNFYFERPDLVMSGRTLFGARSSRNQQLDDHYFGAIPERVLAFMEELDLELHRLGIPAKTRHNEVAPGQFELAQIFRDANVAADNNQIVMAMIEDVARRHNFVALLHEKPFAGINGSGKHLNWSMATDTGINLLGPGDEVHQNSRFLAFTSIVIEAVKRHSKMLRVAVSSQGNDHRLGANEAPPSIISVFTGSTIGAILEAIKDGKEFTPEGDITLDLGANQIANLPQDNTDRNRTSPFAFTGNKFEFRAVGSSHAIGFPLTILNGAVAAVLKESNDILEEQINGGADIDKSLLLLCEKWMKSSWNVIFNGDGYSDEWLKEAESRGLPNLKTTADALPVMMDTQETSFLTDLGIYRSNEIETRYNVLIERYCTLREIEFNTLIDMIHQFVVPAAVKFKKEVAEVIKLQKELKIESTVETDVYKKVNLMLETLYEDTRNLSNMVKALPENEEERAKQIADTLMPLSEQIAHFVAEVEIHMPNEQWPLPSLYDMLFVR
jgi:glutamine synthetase